VDAENRIIEQSQHAEDPNPRDSVLFVRCKGRVGEDRAANPTQERVVAVRVLFNRSVNEHPCCNEPNDVEADKAGNAALFHVIEFLRRAFHQRHKGKRAKNPFIGEDAVIILSLPFGEQKRKITAEVELVAVSTQTMKEKLSKIVESFWLCLGFLFGIVIFGWSAGMLIIFLLRTLVPSLPLEAVTRTANNIADWRSLAVIAIGCVAILCFLLIRSLLSQPLGKLIEKGFAKWDAVVARGGPVVEWIGRFILSKPAPEEIKAAQAWTAKNNEFDKSIFGGDYRYDNEKFEAAEHALRMQKKALSSYPRVKRASKIRGYIIAVPICLFLGFVLLTSAMVETENADDQEVVDQTTDDQEEVVDQTASHQGFENPELRRWWLNLAFACSAVCFPLWLISSLSAERYQRILGADVRYSESDDEVYVANPTDFESWRQAFIDRHGRDMSVEQEKKLRVAVDKVIDADEQARAAASAALRKLSEKIDEIQ
jgi:hypothetical protein